MMLAIALAMTIARAELTNEASARAYACDAGYALFFSPDGTAVTRRRLGEMERRFLVNWLTPDQALIGGLTFEKIGERITYAGLSCQTR